MIIIKGLLRKLPPFSPDYSGVNSVFGQLGGITIIGGADGCIGNVAGYDDPRFFEGNRIFSSGLRNIRAITGDEEMVKKKIEDLKIEGDIPFVLVLATPTSAVIASDYKGLSKILCKEKNIPVISIGTNGMDTYEIGMEKALYQLALNFVKDYDGPRKGVNIIGCTPLNYWGIQQYGEIKKSLESRGVEINSVWSMEGGIENIEKTLEGSINLIVSEGAIKTAKYLEKKYNMPYVVGVPIGKKYGDFIAKQLIQKNEELKVLKDESEKNEKTFLIVGEQVWANSFRNYLKLEYGIKKVKVASFFRMNEDFTEDEDVYLERERNLSEIIEEYAPDFLVGDPFYGKFISDFDKTNFVEIPHLAVSSRLYWDHKILYVGDNVDLF